MKIVEGPLYLVVSGSYSEETLIGLFTGKTLLAHSVTKNERISANLIPLIDTVLKAGKIDLTSLNFIAVDHGPGSFSHLRATLSTMNGIAVAANIPLVGIDMMAAWCEYGARIGNPKEGSTTLLASLYDAFNGEIHYRIEIMSGAHRQLVAGPGYAPPEVLHELVLRNRVSQSVELFFGNGARLLNTFLGLDMYAPYSGTYEETLAVLAAYGFMQWKRHTIPVYDLQPLYLKETKYKTTDLEIG